MPNPVVGSIEFDGDRIVLSFLDPASDVRNEGLLLQTHQLTVLRGPAYADEIAALEEAARELLADALDDFRNTDPVTAPPESDLEDDDD